MISISLNYEWFNRNKHFATNLFSIQIWVALFNLYIRFEMAVGTGPRMQGDHLVGFLGREHGLLADSRVYLLEKMLIWKMSSCLFPCLPSPVCFGVNDIWSSHTYTYLPCETFMLVQLINMKLLSPHFE